jgi:hydrogenase expression/formation protein HypD
VRFLDEYRDERIAMALLDDIRRTATKPWTVMEVCGGQTHTLVRQGIDELLEGWSNWSTGQDVRSASRRWR